MTIYIFGYGSLINRNIKFNKQFDIYPRKIIPVIINNLQRHWIKPIKSEPDLELDLDFAVLGVYDVISSSISNNNLYKTNGLLIEVNHNELTKLDLRERFYIRKEINKNRININLNPEDIIYTYYSDETKVEKTYFNQYSEQNLDYLFICLDGCIKISKKFLLTFLMTTSGFNK